MMFYMAADNDLSGQALIDIKELQKISGQPGIDIIVQLDSPSGSFRYKVLPQGTSILASLGQSNSASPEALANFGSWAVKTYPAQKYLMVLWDHGSGWSKYSKYIGYDQQFNDFLSVAGGGLKEVLAKVSSTAGQPLDIVVFDACLMQMAEVLVELDGLCHYAVGSEALFPIAGMPYDKAWENIDGNTSAESLAASLVNSCSSYDDLGYQVTCSAVDINRLSAASKNLMSLAGRLKQLPISTYIRPTAIPDSALCFLSGYSYDLPLVLDFIGNRIPDPGKTLILDVSQQFKSSVLSQAIAGNDYQKASGLAVWYPNGKNNFESGIEAYRNLKWSGLSGWDKILYQLIFKQDSIAPVPQNVKLAQTNEGVWGVTWEIVYEPSGIERYQIRHSQALTTDFIDRGGSADSSNWIKTGFVIIPKDDGDTAYYSINGQMTSKKTIQFDSSGNIGFEAEGINGSLVLESSSDSNTGWDTLGIWNYFGEAQKRYCSAKVKSAAARVKITWNPNSSSWAYIDDIKVCHPDAAKEIVTVESYLPFYSLSSQSSTSGFYQIMSVDSMQNKSSWSEAIFYQPALSVIKAWPNPFKDKVCISFSSSTVKTQEVKIFNILGQYIDKMVLRKKETNGEMAENLFSWEPQTAIATGVYFAQMTSDSGVRAIKMILIR